MSSDRTFYINHASLIKCKDKIHKDYWKEDHSGEKTFERLYDISGSEEVDLTFKTITIVIEWWEYSADCEKFRNLLKKYKIEFQETS